jgi:DNA polymerase
MTDPATVAPEVADLDALRAAAKDCTGCELHEHAGPTVLGTGPADAWLMLVGEEPGDQEDKAGEPFVGPAGKLLDRALEAAGIERDAVYLTNAVKHFRFEQRGKRRIHKTPALRHIRACRPWLDAELRLVDPAVVGVLGAVAAKALLGPKFKITEHRGEVLEWEGRVLVATVHPSSALRSEPERREEAFDALVADLKVVAAQRR